MFAGTNLKIDEKAKVINMMCKALEDVITEGKVEEIIKMGKKYNISKEKILIDLQEELEISDSQAQEYYEQYSSSVLV